MPRVYDGMVMNAVDTRAIDVMCILIDRLRAQIKRKPSGYRQDQLARAQAELRRRIASQTEAEGKSGA